MTKKGFTLLELLMTLGIIAIIGVGLFEVFNVATTSWREGVTTLGQSEKNNQDFLLIEKTLRSAVQIDAVSLASNTAGFVQFSDANGESYAIFLNNSSNQSTFGSNAYESSSIIGQYRTSGLVTHTEVLLDKVIALGFTTYQEDASYSKIVSPNNVSSPVSLSKITSLKIDLQRRDGGENYASHKLIELAKLELASSGQFEFGVDSNGSTAFTFASHGSFEGFSTQNIDIVPDTTDDPDGLRLLSPTATVTIRGTGEYYTSIQAAIDAAVTGNQVLVAQKEGGYNETLVLKAGVSLIGGYDPVFWYRNLDRFQSVVHAPSGGTDKKLDMQANTMVDGMVFAGDTHAYGIFAEDGQVTIKHTSVDAAGIGIYVDNASGLIVGNRVTGNNQSLVIEQSDDVLVQRNWLYAKNNTSEPNLEVSESDAIYVANNIVVEGDIPVAFTGLAGDFASGSIVNNVIRGGITYGISGINSTLTVYNNMLIEHDIATHFSPIGSVDILNNLFVDNDSGSSSTEPTLPGNTEKNSDTYIWGINDPYFESLATYMLKDSAPDTIDEGNTGLVYHDQYLSGAPSKGTNINDIGAYGGPGAGRVGTPVTYHLEPGDDYQAMIDDALPGDQMVLTSGNYNLSSSLVLRPFQDLSGSGLNTTKLTVSGAAAIQTGGFNTIENMVIDANGNTGFILNSGDNVNINTTVVFGGDEGVFVENVDGIVFRNTTWVENTEGINVTNATLDIHNAIVYRASTGVSNVGGQVTTYGTVFYDNSTDTTGAVTDIATINDDPMFRDLDDDNFLLLAGSSAIDVSGNQDAGAFEYYVNTGHATSPILMPEGVVGLKQIELDVFGGAGFYPDAVGGYSELKVSVEVDGVERFITAANELSASSVPLASFTDSTDATLTFPLPPTIIADEFLIRVYLDGYQFFRTPYINRLQVTW